ncbi:MAG: hypothetical protein ACOCPR_06200 [Guyparkeria sp.]
MALMPTNDKARRRGIAFTAIALGAVAAGFYIAFVLIMWLR